MDDVIMINLGNDINLIVDSRAGKVYRLDRYGNDQHICLSEVENHKLGTLLSLCTREEEFNRLLRAAVKECVEVIWE